ncbi:hypothetical protein JCM8547_000553 [Rhodosporidiobolus lusitaniae]
MSETTWADSIQQELIQFLSQLPADRNPYSSISSFLKSQLFPPVPHSAIIQLYVFCALFALTALAIISSLLIRWRKGIFWVVRIDQSPRMIRPHATISWTLPSVAMIGFVEAMAVSEIRFFRKELHSSFGFLMLLVWGATWLGGHMAAWSLFVSYITHLQATNSSLPTDLFAVISNIVGVGMLVVYPAILLPLGVLGGLHYKHALERFQQIDGLLEQAGRTWTKGESLDILAVTPAFSLAEKLLDNVNSFVFYFRAVFILFAITAGGLVIFLTLVSTLHLSSLRRSLKETTRTLATSNNIESRDVNDTAVRRNPQQKRVHRTLQSLTLTISAMSLLGTFFTGIAILAAVDPLALVSSPTRAQFLTLGPMWAFAFCGFPTSFLLVNRALDAQPSEEKEEAGEWSNGSSAEKKRGGGPGGVAPNEVSVQLAPMVAGADGSSRREQQEDKRKHSGLWTGRSGGGRKGQGDSRESRLSQSVSVQVDVDVVVDEIEEEEGRKTDEEADYPLYPRKKAFLVS